MSERVNGEPSQAEFNKARGIILLWLGLLAAPLAFLLNLQISYMLVPWACVTGHLFWLHAVALASLLLAAAGALVAWRNWQKAGPQWKSESGDVAARSRFMAVLGLLTSGLFFLVILAQWIADFILDPCQ